MELLFYLLLLDSVSSFPFPEYIANSVIKDFGLKNISKVGVIYCAIECAKLKACKTVQYHQTNLQCRLHRLTVKQAKAYKLLEDRRGFLLSELSSWSKTDLKDSCIDVDCGDTKMCLLARDGLTHICLRTERVPTVAKAKTVNGKNTALSTPSKLTYVCDKDWEPVSGPAVEEGSCGQPSKNPHASSPPVKNYVKGDVVKYTCLEGWHRTKGGARIECLSNGTWSSPEFICEKNQGKLLAFGASGSVFEYDLTIGSPKPKLKTRKFTGIMAVCYNVITQTLFYAKVREIFFTNLNNSKKRKRLARGVTASSMSVDSEFNLLFYTSWSENGLNMNGGIYVIQMDSKRNTLLNTGFTKFMCLDKKKKRVYFARFNDIWQMTYQGKFVTRVFKETNIPAMFRKDNFLYIISGNRNKVILWNVELRRRAMAVTMRGLRFSSCGSFLVVDRTLFLVCMGFRGIHTFQLSHYEQSMLESKHDISAPVLLVYIP